MTCACPTCGHDLPNTSDSVVFDFDTGILMRQGAAVQLPPRQADMFKALLDAYPEIVSKGVLMDTIYGVHRDQPDLKVLAVLACHINKKIAGLGMHIDTIWARGHRLGLDEVAA